MRPLFSFIHVTDTHYHSDNTTLEAFVEAVNRETFFPLPELVVHTGDIISGYNASPAEHALQMRDAKRILDRLRIPALLACDNHDTHGEVIRGLIFDRVFGVPHVQEFERDGFYLLLFSGAVDSAQSYAVTPESESRGFGIDTPAGLQLLQDRLRGRARARKLVFAHRGLVSPRLPPRPYDPSKPLPPRSGYGYCMPASRATPVHRILAAEGVLAHYCGHSHINARHVRDGINYISTAALSNFPGEARYIRVYRDRINHRILPVPGGRNLRMRWSANLTDAGHPTPDSYFSGNPDEREFDLLH